ncbi:nitroreductase [Pseudomonas sp. BIGb0408]|uniref:Putative NAD(P)H nitroreductase n=1 Tax=Phytopseudomonas flavescens TaxID=29435 RepID=A0A7Z0BN67_9GAMM|nr:MULTISPECIES: NAD(P)H nitroreductase [Pseudomonas]MCW2292161.1 nitroreductase [Pseudomonas sp. BIGb0408]NYH73267.1 nitroreductase [Pseudomonas flavescens]
MDALDALINRVSAPRLIDPAPTAEQREQLFRAALRAPDHGQLRPWRFLTVEGDARHALGELFAEAIAGKYPDADEEALTKARNMPLRAPLLIVVIARTQEHPKVPAQEQVLAAGCAAHGILLAAYAQGIGAVWRTGELSHDPLVDAGLGLAGNEQVIGYLYLGTPQRELRAVPQVDTGEFVSTWMGNA